MFKIHDQVKILSLPHPKLFFFLNNVITELLREEKKYGLIFRSQNPALFIHSLALFQMFLMTRRRAVLQVVKRKKGGEEEQVYPFSELTLSK